MQRTSLMVVEPELSTFVEQARNRNGRAGLVALVELARRELVRTPTLGRTGPPSARSRHISSLVMGSPPQRRPLG